VARSRNLPDEPWMTVGMEKAPGRGRASGICANCGKAVFEILAVLDDAYNVYWGICPHCEAANALDFSRGRGYTSTTLHLVLPTNEEVIMSNLPSRWPTRGWDNPANEGKTKEQLIARR